MMTHVLVTGGTGTLGRELVSRLYDGGHTVRVMSRSAAPSGLPDDLEWARADLTTGEGLLAAVDGVDAVVHAATSPPNEPPYLEPAAVDVDGTERLVEHAERADLERFVYTSIVGIDDVPFPYYQYKLQAEELVEDADVPSVVPRATQFHEFLDETLRMLRYLPVWTLPTDFRFQPVAAADAADRIAPLVADPEPAERPIVGGPEVLTLGELAASWKETRGVRRSTVPLPLPGETAGAVRDGTLTTPENRQGETTWREWLADDVGPDDLREAVGAAA